MPSGVQITENWLPHLEKRLRAYSNVGLILLRCSFLFHCHRSSVAAAADGKSVANEHDASFELGSVPLSLSSFPSWMLLSAISHLSLIRPSRESRMQSIDTGRGLVVIFELGENLCEK